MAFIDDFKANVPWARDMDNDTLVDYLAKKTGQPRDVVAEDFEAFDPRKSRNPFAVVNDLGIEFANAAAGTGKAAVDFAVPGTGFSRGIQEFIDKGERSQSYKVQRAKRELGEALQSDEFLPQAKGVGKYVWDNPGLAAAQAAGSFVGPGLGIKAARGVAGMRNYATKEAAEAAATRAGTGAAMLTSGAMSGGDAAGNAFELVYNSEQLAHLPEEERHAQATEAARLASIAPGIYGAITGRIGLEGALARNSSKGILRTGAVEAGSEFGDEGISAYSGRKTAQAYDPTINPWTGVAGSAMLGGVLGGMAGTAVGAMTRPPRPQTPPPIDDKSHPTNLLGPTQDEVDAEWAARQGSLFSNVPPGTTPDLFDSGQRLGMEEPPIDMPRMGIPPMEYTSPIKDAQGNYLPLAPNALVDPEFLAAQQVEQERAAQRAAKAKAKAPAIAPVGGAVPVGAAQPLQIRNAVQPALEEANPGISRQKTNAVLKRHVIDAHVATMDDFAASLEEATAAAVDDWRKAEATTAKKGQETARRGEAQILVNWQRKLRGEDPITLEEYIRLREAEATLTQAKETEAQRLATKPLGNAAQAPIVGRQAQSEVQSAQPEFALEPYTGEQESSLPQEQYPAQGEIDTDFERRQGLLNFATPKEGKLKIAKANPSQPPIQGNETRVARRGKKVVEGLKPQTQYTEMGERTGREAPEIAPAVVEDTDQSVEDEIEAAAEKPVGQRPTEEWVDSTAKDDAVQFQSGASMRVRQRGKGESVVKDVSEDRTASIAKAKKHGLQHKSVTTDDLSKVFLYASEAGDAPLRDRVVAEVKRREAAWKKAGGSTKLSAEVVEDDVVDEQSLDADTESEFAAAMGEGDAVQERSAEALDAQESPGDGEGVGEGNAAKPAAAGTRAAETQKRGAGKTAQPAQDAKAPEVEVVIQPDGTRIIRGAAAKDYVDSLLQAESKPRIDPEKVAQAEKRAAEERAKDAAEKEKAAALADTRRAQLEEAERTAIQKTAKQVAEEEKQKPTRGAGTVETKKPVKPRVTAPTIRTGETTAEAAAREWNARKPEGFPAFADISAQAQQDFIGYGPAGWEQADIVSNAARFSRKDNKAKRSQAELPLEDPQRSISRAERPAVMGSPVKAIIASLEKFMRGKLGDKVKVIQTLEEIPENVRKDVERESGAVDDKTQAFVHEGVVWMIGNNIEPGKARSVFLHEVGAHMGIEEMLTEAQFDALVDKIVEWAGKQDSSPESRIAVAALQRVWGSDTKSTQYNTELVAYFIEEAINSGMNPAAVSQNDVGRWFKTLWNAFKQVMRKFGLMNLDTLTAQDMVDFAYGAAKLRISEPGAFVPTTTEAKRSVAKTTPVTTPTIGKAIAANIGDLARRGSLAVAFTQDVADMAQKHLPSVKKYMDTLHARVVERLRMEADVDRVYATYDSLPSAEQKDVDNFLYDSTWNEKWGYAILPDHEYLVDPEYRNRFRTLSPKAQDLVKAVFRHGYDTLRKKQDTIRGIAANEFDPAIQEAQRRGDTAEVKKLQGNKAKTLKSFERLLALDPKKPYAPLTQFGNFVVVAESSALRAAQEAGETDLVDTLKGDGNHYYVQFTNTRAQALALKATLDATGKYEPTDYFRKDDAAKAGVWGGRDTLNAINKLRQMLRDSDMDDKKTMGEVDSMLRDLYLHSLAENSARKSELGRMHVAGTSGEMMRAFVKQGRADAHFVSSIKHNGALIESLADMQKEAGRDYDRRNYYNELLRRYSNSLGYSPTPVQDSIAQYASFWFLATSPAYYFQNLTQPLVMSLPYMAGRHGFFKSLNHLIRAYKEVSTLKELNLDSFDMNALPEDVRGVVQELLNRGRIDIGLERELGEIVAGGSNKAAVIKNNVVRKFRSAVQKVETYNRIVTAMAAFRLGGLEYADKVVVRTHGDYSGMNAPRLFHMVPAPRVIMQFKKFQFIQASLVARMLHDSFKSGSADERFIAKKMLAFTLGHTAAVGGLMGMPFFVPIAAMIGAIFGDDDEPDNPEATLRRLIDDDSISDLLLQGAPAAAGVNLSGKLGMGNMLNPFGMQNVSFKTRGEAAESIIAVIGGPAAALGIRAAGGLGLIGKGDYYKGLEQLLPTGFANAMKGARFAAEGITDSRGAVRVTPEDMSAISAAFQAVGLPTTDITRMSFQSSALYDAEKFYRDKSDKIKRKYVKAVRSGDGEARGEAIAAWQEMQSARAGLGFKRQALADLLRAPQEIHKRERSMAEGVGYTKNNRGFVTQMTTQ